IALPESSLRRRLLLGVALIAAGAVALALGLFTGVPHGGWFVGGGVLAVLLGVSSASPVISRPFLLAARSTYAGAFGSVGLLAGQNSLRNPRRTTATASALMIGLTLACTMAIVGDSAKDSVDKSVAENFIGDYVVSNVFGGPFSPSVADRMRRVDGVQQVIRERFQIAQRGGEREGIGATDPRDVAGLGLQIASGTGDLRDGTVLVSRTW